MKRLLGLLLILSVFLFGCTQATATPTPGYVTVSVSPTPTGQATTVPTPIGGTPTPSNSPTASPTDTTNGTFVRYCTNPTTQEGYCSSTNMYCQPGQLKLKCECTLCPAPIGGGGPCESFCNSGQTSATPTPAGSDPWNSPDAQQVDNGTYYPFYQYPPIEVISGGVSFKITSFGKFVHPRALDGSGGISTDLRVDMVIDNTVGQSKNVRPLTRSTLLVNGVENVPRTFASTLQDVSLGPNAETSGYLIFNPLPPTTDFTITMPGPVDANGNAQQTLTFKIGTG